MTPTFSIVVPTLNRKDMLLSALASVEAQRWPSVEIIVVDGGSMDGTIETLEQRPDIRLLKGPDSGLYDALNKGLSEAQGDIVGFLNSDDHYSESAFRAAALGFERMPAADAVCGAAALVEDGHIIARFELDRDKRLTPRAALIGASALNARFFRRISAIQTGMFDLRYRLVADRDWLIRWHERGFVTNPIDDDVYQYCRHPGSLTFRSGAVDDADFRSELLHLARHWKDNGIASAETRQIARLLEGRCVAALALRAIRERSAGAFTSYLFMDRDRWTLEPALAVARSAFDWTQQSLRPPKPHRR